MPSDHAIAAVMRETGMDHMQAYYHLRGRKAAQEAMQRDRRARVS